jgi:hypothetical protein
MKAKAKEFKDVQAKSGASYMKAVMEDGTQVLCFDEATKKTIRDGDEFEYSLSKTKDGSAFMIKLVGATSTDAHKYPSGGLRAPKSGTSGNVHAFAASYGKDVANNIVGGLMDKEKLTWEHALEISEAITIHMANVFLKIMNEKEG